MEQQAQQTDIKYNNSLDIQLHTYPSDFHRQLYGLLVEPRIIEEKMLLLLRQGRVSKWFSGIGQEAISVAATHALQSDEYILPLHRNLGVFTGRKVPLERLCAQWQGCAEGFTKGRDRSFHFGTNEYHIVGMISHLGPQLCVADGIALAHRLKKEKKVTLVFTGEGGTSEGDFHEALNVAAVWDLPVIFIIENNGYGLSTPVEQQFRCKQLSDRASGYGIEGLTIDGNNIIEVYNTVDRFAKDLRKNPRPVLIECMTFRMRGHEEASGTKYVPKELFEKWAPRDPILRYEKSLLQQHILKSEDVVSIRNSLKTRIDAEIENALSYSAVSADSQTELHDVYAPTLVEKSPGIQRNSTTKKRFIDAISDGMREALCADPNLVVMGQDIAEYGGVFKITDGFVKEFGSERIRNTPLCESGILGAALGLSIKGIPSIVEMQFADFVSCGFNQIVNNLAKVHYRWGQSANVVVRLPTGAGTGAGPFHSQTNEAWFFHVPGLKIAYPSSPQDAKGLLIAATLDPNPVLFFEHKLLYRSISEDVSDGYYSIPFGTASTIRNGKQFSIITYGAGVHWAKEYASLHPESDPLIIDLRTLLPLDYEAIRMAIAETGRVLILHEDTLTGGVGAEIAAWIAQHCFEMLDAPVSRCASLDTPIPFASNLETNFLAKSRLETEINKLLAY